MRAILSILAWSLALARLGSQTHGTDAETTSVSFDLHLLHQLHIPRIGLGTAALAGRGASVVHIALKAGVLLIDTAQATEWYAEEDVGRGIAEYHRELLENVKQQPHEVSAQSSLADLVVVTKVHPRSFREDRLREMVERSRALLYDAWQPDRDHLDVVLLHSPYCWQGHCSKEEESHSWQNAWRALERLKEEGRVKAIGVSNFDYAQLTELEGMANSKVSVVQNWMDPFNQDKRVRDFCRLHGMTYMAYSSMGTQWEGHAQSSGGNPILNNPTLLGIAAAHGTSVAAVVTSWLLQEGVVGIPRASSEAHIEENAFTGRRLPNGNLPVFLSSPDMAAIRSLDGKMGTPWD